MRAGGAPVCRSGPPATAARRLHQVAALPVRWSPQGCEILLITSRRRRRIILPKGWPMRGRSLWEAAAIEAREEAGVLGMIDPRPCGHFHYVKLGCPDPPRSLRVTVFPLEVREELDSWKEVGQRRRFWVPLDVAAGLVADAGLAAVLMRCAAADRDRPGAAGAHRLSFTSESNATRRRAGPIGPRPSEPRMESMAKPVPPPTAEDTADRLRHEISSGRTGDKIAHPDPAAAPLGTDAEAGGHPVTHRQAAMARREELAHGPTPPGRGSGPQGSRVLGPVLVGVAGVVVVAIAWWMRG